MQLTSKLILLALALAYGGTAVSAREYSVAARSAEYADLNAREIDDMELFVRGPFSLFGFGTPRSKVISNNDGTGDGLSKTSAGKTSSEASSLHGSALHETEHVTPKSKNKGRGPHYDPKPTMDVASRRQFRKSAAQNSDLLKEAAKDRTHAFHSTAIHMKQEEAVRKNSKLFNKALNNPDHALHGAAQTVKAQNGRRKATYRAALKDERHPLHEAAVEHRNGQQDKTVRNAQLKNPKLVEAALANKNHKLHEAVHRVAAQDNKAGFDALPFAS